ncbi:MAG: phosphodiester glycosidase family protein [Polyangiaceae bacterium]|nr:phosphodiester glycosidase family protein [Polyangiaceae bacterium]
MVSKPHPGVAKDTSQTGSDEGAIAAINASFFSSPSSPCGLQIGQGELFTSAYAEPANCNDALGFARFPSQARLFDSGGSHLGPAPESWMTEVVTGVGVLVRDGQTTPGEFGSKLGGLRSRTAFGFNQDRSRAILLTADETNGAGLNGAELAARMVEFGAWDAINLDGGGSTEMWIGSEGGLVNQPSDNRSPPSCVLVKAVQPPPPCDTSSGGFAFSCDGPEPGLSCVNVAEPGDPDSWSDNHFCAPFDLGLQWSFAGPIPGMNCVNVFEPSEPQAGAWADNFLCLPEQAPFALSWSVAGPLPGKNCIPWSEPADPGGSWGDNFLCTEPVHRFSAGPFTFSSSGTGGLEGLHCVNVAEPADPDTWEDNFFCTEEDLGLQWSSAGPIAGMSCAAVHPLQEPLADAWKDNFLCAPEGAPVTFVFSQDGPLPGQTCVRWFEHAETSSAWRTSWLCAQATQNAQGGQAGAGGAGGAGSGGAPGGAPGGTGGGPTAAGSAGTSGAAGGGASGQEQSGGFAFQLGSRGEREEGCSAASDSPGSGWLLGVLALLGRLGAGPRRSRPRTPRHRETTGLSSS